jgi:hypothetical protein
MTGNCASAPTQSYTGSFTAHTEPVTNQIPSAASYTIYVTVKNATQNSYLAAGDPLYAQVMLGNAPVAGATISFTSNNNAFYVQPVTATTNVTGNALGYIWGTGTSLANVLITAYLGSVGGTPSNTLVVTYNSPFAATYISSPTSATSLDSGQQVTVSVTPPTTGTNPYTYSWAVAGGYSCPGFGGSSASSFTYTASSTTSATCEFTVTVAESSSFHYSYQVTTLPITVNPVLSAGLLTESNTAVVVGLGYSRLTSSASGGTGPLTINWFANGACSQPSIATGTTYLDSQYLTTTYSYNVVDSATTNIVQCAASNTVTSPVPTGVLYYLPVSTTSSGGAAAANLQVLYTFDAGAHEGYEASSMQNFVAFNGITGTPYNCWLEGNLATPSQTTNFYTANSVGIWCNIPESGWTTDKIYFGFYSTSTNNFNSGGNWGEAPQITGSYGQYDNGASVFSIYANGATSTGSFSTGGGDSVAQTTASLNGASIDVLKFTTGSSESATTVDMFTPTSVPNNPNYYIMESQFQSDGGGTDMEWGLAQKAGTATSNYAIFDGTSYLSAYSNQCYVSGGSRATPIYQGSVTTSWRFSTLTYSSSSGFTGSVAPQLYSTSGGSGGTESTNPIASQSPLYFGWWGNVGASGHWVEYNWIRVRVYPPSGTMPTAVYGAVV